jgi:hypothetical protein
MAKPRIILIEFNELCPPLLEKWMQEGQLPNFKRFYDSAQIFVTESDEVEATYLEPWIQWYSIHTGLAYQEHQVFRLTDGPKSDHKDLWNILIDHGLAVMNFGSMNSRGFSEPGSLYFPDPWCVSEPAWPPYLKTVQDFVQHYVQDGVNPVKNRDNLDELKALIAMCRNGLSIKTISMIVRQLLRERLFGTHERWQRAILLDWIQFDIFRKHYKKLEPRFATYFSNSTAHYQHAYWRCMESEKFEIPPSDEENRIYGKAILFGYQNMDRLLEAFFELEDENTLLVLASALSQQPYLKYEKVGGHRFYRLKDAGGFIDSLGLAQISINPTMTHQYLIRFSSAEDRNAAAMRLRDVRLEEHEVFQVDFAKNDSLYIGCQIRTVLNADTKILLPEAAAPVEKPFFDVFYQLDGMKSGCHHPNGALWLKTGRKKIHPETVSILDIFPTVLDHLDIKTEQNPSCRSSSQSLLSRMISP